MIVAAITGGLGSGKSTVRRLFEERGAVGIDADELARKVVEPGTEGAGKILDAFGPDYFDRQGRLNRKKMARTVFADDRAREQLEGILHPLILAEESRIIEEARGQDPDGVVVVEIPLLAEGRRTSRYDAVIAVAAPLEVRLRRLIGSGRYDREAAEARIGQQATDQERRLIADYHVDNGGTVEDAAGQVDRILLSLREKRAGTAEDA